MTNFHEIEKDGMTIQANGREVRVFRTDGNYDSKAELNILQKAGNRGGAFPVIAHRWQISPSADGSIPGRDGYWFARKFRSHAEALGFVNSQLRTRAGGE